MIPSLGNFGQGLPALLGVALGIRVYTGGRVWFGICVAVLAVAVVAIAGGLHVMARRPVAGAWIIEFGILAPICVTALVTSLIVWMSAIGLPSIFGQEPDEEVRKTLASTLVGAVTAYAAIVWTKDISDETGLFWPSTHFKAGMKAVQIALIAERRAKADTIAFQAIFNDQVESSPKILGWDFNARRRRAAIGPNLLKQ